MLESKLSRRVLDSIMLYPKMCVVIRNVDVLAAARVSRVTSGRRGRATATSATATARLLLLRSTTTLPNKICIQAQFPVL